MVMTNEELDIKIKKLMDDIGFYFRKSRWEEMNTKDKAELHSKLVSIWYLLGDYY